MSVPFAPPLWVLVAVADSFCPGVNKETQPCTVGVTEFLTEGQCIAAMPAWNRYLTKQDLILLHCIYNWAPGYVIKPPRIR